MAAVAVTSANTNSVLGAARATVRTSAGIPYVCVYDSTNGKIEMFKGNATTPTSFSEQDSAHRPSGVAAPAIAIDSTGLIHVGYYQSATTFHYNTFSTSTNLWGTGVQIDGMAADLTEFTCAIAVDSNDKPHVAFFDAPKNMGTAFQTLQYMNKVGASWSTVLQVEGASASVNCRNADIAIDTDNKPVISYTNVTDTDYGTAIGNANDATSFTLQDIETDAETTSGQNTTSIAVDSSGNHWVAFRTETNGYIKIRKHNYGDAWSTWQTTVTNSNNGVNPSLIINGTDVYVFYEEDTANDIVYDKYTGSWLGETSLETGTYNSVKAKWGFCVNNGSGGSLVDGSSPDRYDFSNQNNTAYRNNYIGQAFTGSGEKLNSIALSVAKSGSPTGNAVIQIYNETHSTAFGTDSIPTGSILATSDNFDVSALTTSSAVKSFTFSGANQITLTNGSKYVAVLYYNFPDINNYITVGIDSTSPTHAGNYITSADGSSWTPNATMDIVFLIFKVRNTASELDYVFADETASPDILWNELTLGGGTTTQTKNNSAKASIVVTSTQSNSSKVDILVVNNVSNDSVKASIVTTPINNNSSLANILAVQTKNNSSKASVVVTNSKDNSSLGNILATLTKNNSVIGNILATGQQPNSVRADIDVIASQNNYVEAYLIKSQENLIFMGVSF